VSSVLTFKITIFNRVFIIKPLYNNRSRTILIKQAINFKRRPACHEKNLTTYYTYDNFKARFYKQAGGLLHMKDKVEEVLNKIRPSLIADGGNVELVDVKDGIVSLKLTGACAGCPMSTMTLKNGIERILKEELSDVKEVVSVESPV
jgi:Fe-S cluster biogenesis protein NfuA